MYKKFALYYDEVLNEIEYSKWAKYIKKIISDNKNNEKYKTFLELGCGTGNLFLKFINDYKISVGLDKSYDMIKKCYEKTAACDISNLLVGDIYNIPLKKRFDIIIAAFDTINYLTEIKGSFWKQLAARKSDSGIILFDFITDRFAYIHNHHKISTKYKNFIHTIGWKYNYNTGILISTVEISNNDSTKVLTKEEHIQRCWNKDKMYKSLKKHFKEIDFFDFMTFNKADKYDERIQVVLK